MCKQYIYFSRCRQPHCETLVGRKNRNRYCPEALRARRLGACAAGVEVKDSFTGPGRAACGQCKARKPATATGAGAGEPGDGSGSGTAPKPRDNKKRKADGDGDVDVDRTPKRARKEAGQRDDDRKRAADAEAEPRADETGELLVVRSPVGAEAGAGDPSVAGEDGAPGGEDASDARL